MPKYNVRTQNPERFKVVAAKQAELLKALHGEPYTLRVCPYCDHKIAVQYAGYHGPEIVKCSNCGECAVFPALKISGSIDRSKAKTPKGVEA